jgi:hypothetical protein
MPMVALILMGILLIRKTALDHSCPEVLELYRLRTNSNMPEGQDTIAVRGRYNSRTSGSERPPITFREAVRLRTRMAGRITDELD